MVNLIKLLKWLDDNLVKIFLIGFIFIIPLYPKIPFLNVNYTYIAIRLEDFYTALMIIVFLIQFIRKKVKISRFFLISFAVFWFFVFLSVFYGIYIQKTLDYHKVAFLHALRRVEYMSVFFIAASVIKSKKDFWQILQIFILVLLIVNAYAFGQKFLGFPAIQTMNPEFAKGNIVYLTPEARVSSTFGGHYDLSSYLILLMPLALALYFHYKRSLYFIVFAFSLLSLFYTASRISFAAYLISISLFLIFSRKFLIYFFILSLTINIAVLTGDLSKRFLKTFQIKQILVDEKTGEVFVPQQITTKELPIGSFYVKLKDQSQKETQEVKDLKKQIIEEKVIAKNNPPPPPPPPPPTTLPSPGVSVTPTKTILKPTATPAPTSGMAKIIAEDNALASSLAAQLKSVNTIVSDISFATRLQVEWPRAIKAFLFNVFLGTGPSSITEATDNDYLRWLGETGILGTGSFIFILASITMFIFIKTWKNKKLPKYIFTGALFSILGILINATYIDVFEASKVAFTFWTLIGVYVGFLQLDKKLLLKDE